MNIIYTGQTIGRYRITEQLGQGGMAVVYKAFDTQLERDVAIKLIRVGAFPPDILDHVLERFKREAKTLARLNHPNIVKVHDFGEIDGAPFLVMDYLSGHTFKEIRKPIRPEAAARLMLPIAEALSYAHSQGVFHRDIKPSNIILNDDQSPILMDFGISKLLEEERGYTLTGTGIGLGTPEYMAPEQGLGKTIDGRADLYSMGIVFYELITGHKPYQADTAFAVLYKQMNDPLPDPRQFVPDLSDEVEQFLVKALAKKPNDRYSDMEEFKKGLSSLISNKQTSQELRPQDNSQPILQLENTFEKINAIEPITSIKKRLPDKKNYKRIWIITCFLIGMISLFAVAFQKNIISFSTNQTNTPIATKTKLKTPTPTRRPTLTITPVGREMFSFQSDMNKKEKLEAFFTNPEKNGGPPEIQDEFGTLWHDEDDFIEEEYILDQINDFILSINFVNPHDAIWGDFSFGIEFRDEETSSKGNRYFLAIRSDGYWVLQARQMDSERTTVNDGYLDQTFLKKYKDEENVLKIIAIGTSGGFSLNGHYISDLDLSKNTQSGSIYIFTGFWNDDEADGHKTAYHDLNIWSYSETEEGTNACLSLNKAYYSHVYGSYVTKQDGKDIVHGATVVISAPDLNPKDQYEINYSSVMPSDPSTYIPHIVSSCQIIQEKLHCTLNPIIFSTHFLNFSISLKDSSCSSKTIKVPEADWQAMFNACKQQ